MPTHSTSQSRDTIPLESLAPDRDCAVGAACAHGSHDGTIEVRLPPIEEQWKTQRHAHDKRSDDRQPTAVETQPGTFDNDEYSQRHSGQNDVQAEKRADTVGEHVLHELLRIWSVLDEPWEKVRVG